MAIRSGRCLNTASDLRISGNMLHKKFTLYTYLKKAGLPGQQNIVHLRKNILCCVGFCLYILRF